MKKITKFQKPLKEVSLTYSYKIMKNGTCIVSVKSTNKGSFTSVLSLDHDCMEQKTANAEMLGVIDDTERELKDVMKKGMHLDD